MYLLGINYDDIPNYNIINENFEHDNIQNYSHFKHIGKYPLTNKEVVICKITISYDK